MIKEAEQGLLSALIHIDDFAHTLPIKLIEEDFLDSGNRIIAKVLFKLHGDGQEKITKKSIISTAQDMGLVQFNILTNDGALLDEICASVPLKEEAILFLKQVKKEAMREIAADRLQELRHYVQTTDESLQSIFAKVEDGILGITTSTEHSENTLIDLTAGIDSFIDMLGENPGHYGLDIGFPEWQDKVGGVANGRVHMFIANFKTGKSTIGQRAALLLSKHIPVLIVDTEMTAEEQKERLFCQLIKMPYDILKKKPWKIVGTPEHSQWFHIIQQGKKEFKKLKISYLEAHNKSISEMIPAMRRWAIQHKVTTDTKNPQGLIIYDYVKLIGMDEMRQNKLAEWQKLGLDIGILKGFANKYRVPVLTFGQTNREDDSTWRCLGASKRIADNVDSLTLFKEKTPEILSQDATGTHLFRIFAVRSGAGMRQGEHINISFDKSIGHMQELGVYTPSTQAPIKKSKRTHNATADEITESAFDTDDDEVY